MRIISFEEDRLGENEKELQTVIQSVLQTPQRDGGYIVNN